MPLRICKNLNNIAICPRILWYDIARIVEYSSCKKIELDDWRRSVGELPNAAEAALNQFGQDIEKTFLSERVIPYRPLH